MSKLIAAVFGVTCFLSISAWSWVISNENDRQKTEASLPSTSLNISDSEFSFSANDIFSFHQSDATPVIPGDNLVLLQQLARYLGENPERELELNGLFSPSEKNKSQYRNLGIARAKAIEKLLISEGTSEEQLITSATEVQNLFLINGRLLGGVNFIFSESEAAVQQQEEAKGEDANEKDSADESASSPAKEEEKNIRVFHYQNKEYKLDQAHRPYLDSLRNYLRKRPRETVIISGYSESEEEREVSGNLAELRAKAVRRYLVDTGLRRRQIVVVSHPGTTKNEDGHRVELKIERE
jgi:outer membrane protein OmpA-like peptidoglycan-associated protein